jgi:hypothetical protein
MNEAELGSRMPWAKDAVGEADPGLGHEWLVTNGLGGYAAGTIDGVPTRRFHAYLVAALPAPLGRVVALNHLHRATLWSPGAVSAVLAEGEDLSLSASTEPREVFMALSVAELLRLALEKEAS